MNTHIFFQNEHPASRFPERDRFAAHFQSRPDDREPIDGGHQHRHREHDSSCRPEHYGFDARGGHRGRGHGGHGWGVGGPAGRGGFEGGFGGRGGGPGGFERGFGGPGRGRLFDSGDIRLVVLQLLSEQPSYGYQLIKTMEQRLAGGYTPSAGVIYPTLTLLEEEGLTTASTENNKKVYSVTPEGAQFIESNKRQIEELFARLAEAGKSFERGRSPEIMKAFMDLRGAVVARVSRESITPEQITKITEAIKAAAKAIDEL